MLGSVILDVAIGLVVVYLLLSLVCSAIREGIEAILKARATHLERGLRELLNDQGGTGITSAVYAHPLICGLFQGAYDPRKIKNGWMPRGSRLPSYIPSANFATALLDIVTRGADVDAASAATAASTPITLDSVRRQISTIQNPFVQRALLVALDTAEGDLQKAQANIEAWYDSAMDRVSGWYKRKTQAILFGLGLFVAIAGNVDTLAIARFLYADKPTREALVAEAQRAGATSADAAGVIAQIQALRLPIGWSRRPEVSSSAKPPGDTGPPESRSWLSDLSGVLEPIPGWITTAFAISLGAPFWFDVLKRVMEIRASVKPGPKPDASATQPTQQGGPAVTATTAPPSAESLFRPHEWSTGDPQGGVL